MSPLRFPVAVIMQRIPLASRWADERWEAVAVETCDDAMPAQTLLNEAADTLREHGIASTEPPARGRAASHIL